MKPITREEQYLNRLTGEEGIIPDKPVTREEQYFARLCGGDNVIPDKPVTRREQYLATLCGEDVITPTKPVTRIEQYMAFASGESESKPEKPITREEMYWDKYQGGDVPEEKTIAFTDIITVTDALARPAVDLQSEITATQNLNGYEYPWVGGAGKNKLNITATTQTINDVTFTVNSDGTISLSGTASENTILDVATFSAVGGTAYKLSGCPSGGSTSKYLLSISSVGYDNGSGYNYTPSTDADVSVRITIYSGQNTQGLVFKPMICLASEPNPDYAHFVPYENICPISGRTEVNVTRTGKNITSLTTFSSTPRVYWGSNWSDMVTFLNTLPNGTYTITLNFKTETVPDVSVQYAQPFIRAIVNGTIVNVTSYVVQTDSSPQADKIYKVSVSFTINDAVRGKIAYCYLYCRGTSSTEYGTFSMLETQVEQGSTATAYEPYEGDTFNTELGRTVYGGTLDLTTGELKITHAIGDLTGYTDYYFDADKHILTIRVDDKDSGYYHIISDRYRNIYNELPLEIDNGVMTEKIGNSFLFIRNDNYNTLEEFMASLTGTQFVYKLKTPQTISLTPTEVMMFENNNTIWADAGRVQLTYLSKAAERVQLMNASLKANTLKISKGAVKK